MDSPSQELRQNILTITGLSRHITPIRPGIHHGHGCDAQRCAAMRSGGSLCCPAYHTHCPECARIPIGSSS